MFLVTCNFSFILPQDLIDSVLIKLKYFIEFHVIMTLDFSPLM